MREQEGKTSRIPKIETAADAWRLTQQARSGNLPKVKEIVGKIMSEIAKAANRGKSTLTLHAMGDKTHSGDVSYFLRDDEMRYAFIVLESCGFKLTHYAGDQREQYDTSCCTISWENATPPIDDGERI